MSPVRVVTWQLRAAMLAFSVATVAFVVAAWRATHFASASGVIGSRSEPRALAMGSYRFSLASELDRAVDFDPFRPERNRPPVRYQLPGTVPVAVQQPASPPEQIELLGTVVSGAATSFAMCQTSAGPQIVHIGAKFAGFTLKSVQQGSAVFLSPEGKPVTFTVK
jgi:hypothetical protein